MNFNVDSNSAKPTTGFLTAEDATDVGTWSGTPFYMAKALERHLGPVKYLGPLQSSMEPVVRAFSRLIRLATGKRLLVAQTRAVSRQLESAALDKISTACPDVVFAPAGSTFIGRIPEGIPVVYSSDATARLLDSYHPNYRSVIENSKSEAERLEATAIKRADLLLYPTDWVARSAVDDYGADPDKIHIVEYGANLLDWPQRNEVLKERPAGRCRLLFVGVDWKEKGAAIALDTLRALHGMNIAAELTICGGQPDHLVKMDGLTIVPFLDKNDPRQLGRLIDLYRNANFFLLPSRADCYGISYCEASAYGVPSIGTATGGVPDVVREGENGHLLPVEAEGAAYASLIAEILQDKARYDRLRISTRDSFENRLNWDVWGGKTARLITDLLTRRLGSPKQVSRDALITAQ